MLDLADKHFKVVITNVFKEQQEAIFKEIKENETVAHQIETTTKGKSFKNQIKTLELKGQ